MGMSFQCYLIRDLDYPYIARVENIHSGHLWAYDHEFSEWGEIADISFYRAGKEFCFANEYDRLMFMMRWG
jgi:hypothetical protein